MNQTAEGTGSDESTGGIDPARLMVAMMFVGYALNYMDRQMVTVLLEPIKAELKISDTEIGLLTGFSFAIFYAAVCVPIAALADRYSRKKIIAACLGLWSIMTGLFGLASNYPQMFIARMFVGVGEAGFAPAAFSMIADYFPREKRTTATAIGATGAMLGTTIGLSGGGYVAQWVGWRATLCIAAVPGLFVALLFLLIVKEPKRGLTGGAAAVGPPEASRMRALLHNPVYLLVVFSSAANCFVMYACLHWMPSFLIRSYHVSGRTAGLLLGPVLGGVGAASLLCSGYVTDLLSRRDLRWGIWLPGLTALLAAPLFATAFYSSHMAVTVVLFSVAYFCALFFSAPTIAMIQFLVPLKLRARATAIFILLSALAGFGFGPSVAGFVSEAYKPLFGAESLRFALMSLTPVLLISAILLGLAARRLPASQS